MPSVRIRIPRRFATNQFCLGRAMVDATGAGAMKDGWSVRVSTDGVGELVDVFDAS